MRQAEFKLRAANAQVGVAQTDLFPKIRLTSNYGFESDELSSILKSPAGFIAGSLLQPIFAMGKNKAKVKAAKARYEQEVYSYEKSVLGAFKEVNNAIVTVRKVKEIRASRMNLEASASNIWNSPNCNTSTVSSATWTYWMPSVVCWTPRSV